jgi:hypothetical protein
LLARSAGVEIEQPLVISDDLRVQFELLLASGGGPELWPDPATGRTLGGSLMRPAPHEIWLSSTDATAPSPYAHAQALAVLARLTGQPNAPALTLTRWFDGLRGRIARQFGAPGAAVFLTPSIADARNLARAIAFSVFGETPAEIIAGADESSEFQFAVTSVCEDVPLRDDCGMPREREEVDTQAKRTACDIDGPLLVHMLDCSRTGLAGISRAACDDLAQYSQSLIVVDASAMRTSPEFLRGDLMAGRMVILSGSTFLSGPASCAALMVPASILPRLAYAPPAHLIGTLSAYDMEHRWREWFCPREASGANIGLGLRWSAALAELDRYLLGPAALRDAIVEMFVRKSRALIARCEWVLPEPRTLEEDDDVARSSIVPLILRDASGSTTTADCAASLREALATSIDEPGDAVCHVGAPIALAERYALPLSVSAPLVSDVVGRISRGVSFERAFAPVLRDLDSLFRKIERVA